MAIKVTEDGLVLTQSNFGRLIYSPLGGLWIFSIFIGFIYSIPYMGASLYLDTLDKFWSLLMFIFCSIFLTDAFFFGTTVTFDKTHKRIFFKKDSIVKVLGSIKEIPFSDIKAFQIKQHLVEWHDYWSIHMIKNNNKSEFILYSEDSFESESVASMISYETGKDIVKKNQIH